MARPIRLSHSGLGQHFLVDAGSVYADLDGDGRIAKRERYYGEAAPALLAAARHFDDIYDAPFPGARSLDPEIRSGGRLNDKEVAKFSDDTAGIVAKRPDLMGHLDFFDRADSDGMITVRENYNGWRDLGYGAVKSLVLALGSAVVFGRVSDGFAIDVERIAEKRPKGSTGIYGPDGNVDQARLEQFASAFEPAGILTHEQLRAALARQVALGTIPRRQFESLYLLTERMNGAKVVTREQFLGLFDNSLFWAAASLPRGDGGRRL